MRLRDLFKFLRGRGGLENPTYSLTDPDDTVFSMFGGGTAASGEAVNAKTALNYASVWRAVNLISRDVAKMPLFIYRRLGEGKDRAPEHPAYRLLRWKASPYLTAFEFRRRCMRDVLLKGNAYAVIKRTGSGAPGALIPLETDETQVHLDGGQLWYETKVNGQKMELGSDEVFHIRGCGDGYVGMSVIEYARNSFGLGLAAANFASRFFANGGRANLAIKHPASLKPQAVEHLKKTWQAAYGTAENYGKVPILEEGMEVQQFGISNADAQFLETRQFEIREIANWFGIPPHKLGDPTRTAFASLEQENQSYLDDALDGWLCTWEYECWDKLLTQQEQERDTHVIEFLRQSLVRTNLKDRGAFYNLAVQGGWMSRDEVRSRENLNPIPDGEGEKFFVPLNMGIAGEPLPEGAPGAEPEEPEEDDEEPETPKTRGTNGQGTLRSLNGGPSRGLPQEAPPAAELKTAFRGVLTDLTRRMARRVASAVRKASRTPEAYCEWLEKGLEEDHAAVIREAAEPVAGALRAGLGLEASATEYCDLFLAEAKEELWRATDHPPAELGKYADLAAKGLEAALLATVVDQYLEKDHAQRATPHEITA